MSVSAIERVLWEMGDKAYRVEQFKADPDAYLATRDLSDQEREWIKNMDVKSLVDHGVSSMLTMMAWPLIHGVDELPFDYLTKMNGGTLPDMGLNRFQHFGLRTFLRCRRAWWAVAGKPNKQSMGEL
ncbi:MAG: hypothetical protein VW985_03445 [Gammaproteobacteria bacterium]